MRLHPIHNSRNQGGAAAVSSARDGNGRPTNTRTRSNSARSPMGKLSEDGYGLGTENQAWAIGDISDDDSDVDAGGKDKGRASSSRPREEGERGGLLFDEAEEEEEEARRARNGAKPSEDPPIYASVEARVDSDDEDEDPFGDFKESKTNDR